MRETPIAGLRKSLTHKMIQEGTVLTVVDNSGAKKVKCIKVLGGFKRKFAHLGDIIVVSVKQLRTKNRVSSKISKGSVVRALIIKTRTKHRKGNGHYLLQDTNAVVLLNRQSNLIGTRILSAIPKSLKKKKISKIPKLVSRHFLIP